MARIYTVTAENTTITGTSTARDFCELTPADDKPIRILGFEIDNVSNDASDVKEAGEENVRLSIIRGHTTSGSGGSAPTPVALDPGDAAPTFTAETNNTTIASGGSPVTLWVGGMNVRIPGPIFFGDAANPLMCPKASQANGLLVLRCGGVLDAIEMSITVWVLEE